MIFSIIALSISNLVLLFLTICCSSLILSQLAEIQKLTDKNRIQKSIIKGAKAEIEIHRNQIKKLESQHKNRISF